MKPIVGSYLMFLKEPKPVIVWFCTKKEEELEPVVLSDKKDNP